METLAPQQSSRWLVRQDRHIAAAAAVACIKSNQIKSNQIYLPAQNIKKKQLKNIRLTHKKSTTNRL